MIRFVIGFLTIIAGVGAIEGTVPLGMGILITAVGIVIFVWSLEGLSAINNF